MVFCPARVKQSGGAFSHAHIGLQPKQAKPPRAAGPSLDLVHTKPVERFPTGQVIQYEAERRRDIRRNELPKVELRHLPDGSRGVEQ